MAVTWVRGQRCGVNNCLSQFYQVSGGHRVCQNGHVQEGFEALADDDEFAAIGRRINIPRKQKNIPETSLTSKVVHGREAFDLTLNLMQDVLIAQVQWLRRKKGLTAMFENIVHSLWIGYLALLVSPNNKVLSNSLSLRDLLILCYFGIRCVGAPILMIDMLRWIPLDDFPYISSQKWLDPNKYDKVPIEQRRVFTALVTPTNLVLHHRMVALRGHLERILQREIPRVDESYALIRLCRELMLPPEMYIGARSLLRVSLPKKRLWAVEEIPMALALVMATKLAYGLDGIPRVLAESRKGEQIDWAVWKDVVRKVWVYQPNPMMVDERLAIRWDDHTIDNYLAWQRHRILPQDKPRDRLLTMFPLHTEQPNYDIIDNDTLTELTGVVHSTSMPYEDVAETPDLNVGAGSNYQVYSNRKEFVEQLPEITEALYEVVGTMFNTDISVVRNIVRYFEGWVRRTYASVAYWDAPENEAIRR